MNLVTTRRSMIGVSARAKRLSEYHALDLGSGKKPADGYHGLDTFDASPNVSKVNLVSGEPWPFADESIDLLHSSHFIEHIPASDVETFEFVTMDLAHSATPSPFVRSTGPMDALAWFMNECWRVAKKGCVFTLIWPSLTILETGQINPRAFQDPTHRRFIPHEQLQYFSAYGRTTLGVEHYGATCDWHVTKMSQRETRANPTLPSFYDFIAILEKP